MGERYDLGVIGAGSAAFAAAIRATSLGARVALVERGTVGGTCVNVGCVPSKHLLAASRVFHDAAEHPFAGVPTSRGTPDLAALIARKDDVVASLLEEKYVDLAAGYGFELVRGRARFAAPDRVEVDGRPLEARRWLIATGSEPWVPPIDGLEQAGYLTSTTAMELGELPASLVVIGGNAIGLELAQAFANLGSQVTVVEALERIAPFEEPEISAALAGVLRDEGIRVLTSARVTRVEGGAPRTVVARIVDEEIRVEGSHVLVATGRRPALDGLGLDVAGIELDDRGGLVLDPSLRTTNPNVFAAGDVTRAPQFVYVSAAQGTLAAENALSGTERPMDLSALPRVTFTTPTIASVGLTDAQARDEGYACECRVVELRHVPRARVELDTRGLFKIVAEARTGTVLGIHALGDGAGDAILAGVYAVRFGLTVTDLAETWAPYLTMAEGIRLAAQSFTTDVERLSCCAA